MLWTQGKNCKTKKNEMHARVSRLIVEVSRIYRKEANLDGSNSYRASIVHPETSLMDQVAIEKLSKMR